jgi:tetratricopeptide (TPR) repeat protein
MTSPIALAVAFVLALVGVGAPAGERNTARQLFDAGSLAYARGRYDDAARAFEAAYRLMPRSEVAFSLAQAQRRQYFVDHERPRLVHAVALYRGYLDDVAEGGRREDAVEQLQSLEPLLLRLDAADPGDNEDDTAPPGLATELIVYASQPGAVASVDDGPQTPVPAIVSVAPGLHRIEVKAEGFLPTSVTATALADRLLPVQVDLVERPAMLRLRANKRARILVDGREVGHAPLLAPLELAPGRHALSVTAPGRVAAERVLALQRGETTDLTVHLPRTMQRDVALALLGSSAALWVGGAVTMGVAFRFQARAREVDAWSGERNIDAAQRQALDDDVRRRDQLRGATVGLWTAAAVTGIVGLILVLTDRR